MKLITLILGALLVCAAVAPETPKEVLLSRTISAYCPCKKCCGPTAPNLTAIGVWPIEGITVAGPRRFPLGTRVKITFGTNVLYRTIHDRLNTIYDNRFDLFFTNHDTALKFGIVTNAVVSIY